MKIRKENDLRKIIVLLLTAAVLVVGMLPGTVLATGSTDIASGTDWVLDADGKLTISSNAGMTDWITKRESYKEYVISVEISGGVSNIGERAFYECSNLASVSIPASVGNIDNWAFHSCGSLKSVTIPALVSTIGQCAFLGCSSLESVTIPEGVERIEGLAFWQCTSLESIMLPESVTYIGNGAFQETSLKSITIPERVTEIGQVAFRNCTSLAEVAMLGETPPVIGGEDETFTGCKFVTDNKKGIHVLSGKEDAYKTAWTNWADYIGAYIVSGTDWTLDADGRMTITSDAGMTDWIAKVVNYRNFVKSVNISDGVTNIGEAAFLFCGDLTSVTIPDSVTSIGTSAFESCVRLEEITIPERVTKIKTAAFRDCMNLAEVIMLGETPPSIEIYIFNNCKFVTDNKKGIRVPAGKADAYRGAWTEWADYITDDAKIAAEAKTAAADKLKNITVTNATTKEEILSAVNAALNSAGISGVTVTVEGFTKTEATALATGSIRGTVKLTCGNQTETVTINQTIAKLPNTGNEAAKKVAEAKTAAKGALQTIKLTNAATKEEIQSAVNAALNSAGISGVTVTVENFTKTEATTSAAGSIRATVKITCGNQTETVTIN